jgi:CHAT domain-containing protein
VLELIQQRQYSPGRKPFLAFGGAVYDDSGYEGEMVDNEAQLAYLQKQVEEALRQDKPVGQLYARLRGGQWKNLPGTLDEVSTIQHVINEAVIFTGKDVNETLVKTMSASGELQNYKVLHFATHGDANPAIPELSALVLSLGTQTSLTAFKEDDGYLCAGEIYQLKLNADFVNLSACETGLGKLYKGEGVVGLTQAFVLAGANGLSVSLWQVADESTAQFMVALYTLVEKEGMSYIEAITEVKRRFINGDFGEQWTAPYYWAPFVYYGK